MHILKLVFTPLPPSKDTHTQRKHSISLLLHLCDERKRPTKGSEDTEEEEENTHTSRVCLLYVSGHTPLRVHKNWNWAPCSVDFMIVIVINKTTEMREWAERNKHKRRAIEGDRIQWQSISRANVGERDNHKWALNSSTWRAMYLFLISS